MKPTNFRGRKNARRVNALAEKQEQIADAQTAIEVGKRLQKSGDAHVANNAAFTVPYLEAKLIRLQKNASNLAGKIMEQGAAEAVRTKKNRSGFQRARK